MVGRFLLLKNHFLEMYCTEIHKQPLKMDFNKVFTEQRPLLLRYFENLNAMTYTRCNLKSERTNLQISHLVVNSTGRGKKKIPTLSAWLDFL